MAQTQISERPTSPHLWHWRWHITMATSILHRITGVVLYLGAIGLVLWLGALASGADAYDRLVSLVPSWAIEVELSLAAAAVAFHLANGVRHLAFDLGAGFKPKTADASAWLAILFALAAGGGVFALIHRGGL